MECSGNFSLYTKRLIGEIISIGELAEKIRAVLRKAEVLLVPKGQGLPVKGIKVIEVSSLKEAVKIALKK